MRFATVLTVLALLQAAASVRGEDRRFPAPEWKDAPNPIASPFAAPGGELRIFSGQYPKSLNYYLDTTSSSAEVFGWLYESLLGQHPLTLALEPSLASAWTVSEDLRTLTFTLDDRARWSDGQPVTAADVLWTFQAIMNPANLTGPHKVGLERFETPEVLDEHTIRFRVKQVHWNNLITIGFLQVLPKHAFEQLDFNKINFSFPVVSGPYRLGAVKEGVSVVLERRKDWWQRGAKRHVGTANFGRLRYRYFGERENGFEAFKKGEIDLFPIYTAHRWANETSGPKFQRNWIVKQEVYNRRPIGFQGFAMNLRRPLFQDVRVRRALAHLLDREKMNHTLMHDAYFLQRSYYEDLYSKEHPCADPVYGFDKDRARALLAEAGWSADPKTGLLSRGGAPFVIHFLTRSADSDKFLAIYKEDLRDVGIDLDIVRKDWAAWVKDMDEYHYDMTWAAWGAGVRKDPEPMWYSKEADRPSGQNITGFKDPEVDRLVEQQRTMMDVNERHALVRRIDRILTEQVPYLLLWNINYTRMLYWNRFGTPPTVLGKYGDEQAAQAYWWYDEDAAADLDFAMTDDQPVAPRPARVVFDDVFTAP